MAALRIILAALVVSAFVWDAGAERVGKGKRFENAISTSDENDASSAVNNHGTNESSALPDCNSWCSQMFDSERRNDMTRSAYVNRCTQQQQGKGCVVFDTNRCAYYSERFALPAGQTCSTVCVSKAADKLSNPYAPLFQNEYKRDCMVACEHYASSSPSARGGGGRGGVNFDTTQCKYYTKPFALPAGQTCSTVCASKATDKLSNPYAPYFQYEYKRDCRVACNTYASGGAWDTTRVVYYTKPFTLPIDQTCDKVCGSKAMDKLSNKYAPNFQNEYKRDCVPICEKYTTGGKNSASSSSVHALLLIPMMMLMAP